MNEVSSLVHPGPDTHPVPPAYSGASQYPKLLTELTTSEGIQNSELDTESVLGTESGHCENSETFTDQTLHRGSVRFSQMDTGKVTRFVGSKYSDQGTDQTKYEGSSLTYPLDGADSDSGIEEELEYLLRSSEDSSSRSDDEGAAASDIVDPSQETCSVKVVVEASVHYPPARVICDEEPG